MSEATWDQSRFDAALRETMDWGKRAPAKAVNTAAFYVARGWSREMPRVPIGRMDTELSLNVVKVQTKSGRYSRSAKKWQQPGVWGPLGERAYKSEYRGVPLLALIIQARSNLLSKYSFLTSGRWHRPSPFRGKSRAAGAAAMRAEMRRVLMVRHKSSAYLASSVKPIIKALEPFVDSKYRRGAPPVDRATEVIGADKGGAFPAKDDWNAVCVIHSDIGTTGVQAAKQNAAQWRHGAPALQRSFDAEAESMTLKVAKWEMEDAAKRFNAMAT